MKHIRFTIAGLLGVILVLGIGFAGLRESSDPCESGLFTLTIGVLLISILAAIHRLGSKRAFWIGFALFGWTYLGLALVPSIESRLITTKGLASLASRVAGDSVVQGIFGWNSSSNKPPENNIAFDVANSSQPAPVYVKGTIEDITVLAGVVGSGGTTENFVRIGHSLLTLIAALLGGLLSRHLHAGNRAPVSRPVNQQV